MVDIVFSSSKLTRVTKGSLGGKFVIPGDVKNTRKPIAPKPIRLPPGKEKILREHSKGHTKRHMDYMRQMMTIGLSYKEAHQRAAQFIGR